jgi:hypothetical protein
LAICSIVPRPVFAIASKRPVRWPMESIIASDAPLSVSSIRCAKVSALSVSSAVVDMSILLEP